MSIQHKVRNLFIQGLIRHKARPAKRCTHDVTDAITGLQKLTSQERLAVKKVWDVLNIPYEFTLHEFAKKVAEGGFNPNYVPTEIFFPYILRCLNPAKFSGAYEYKGTYHRNFKEIPQPKYYINVIGDVIYDNEENVISDIRVAKDILRGKSFLVKPTKESACGKNVIVIKNATLSDIQGVFDTYKSDFIVQEICTQSEKTKVFNPSSLNTFRVTTLYLNGKFSVLNILFRCGRGDTVVDNGGAGGLMCGCDTNGQLKPYAYDIEYQEKFTHSTTGQEFGVIIPEVKDIISLIESNIAQVLPFCAFAGWDFALNAENKPIMIEVNLGSMGDWPGTFAEQICPGMPLFGERTEEVIEWVKNNPPHIRELFMS